MLRCPQQVLHHWHAACGYVAAAYRLLLAVFLVKYIQHIAMTSHLTLAPPGNNEKSRCCSRQAWCSKQPLQRVTVRRGLQTFQQIAAGAASPNCIVLVDSPHVGLRGTLCSPPVLRSTVTAASRALPSERVDT